MIKVLHKGPGDSIESKATGAHLGRDKTRAKVAERFFWPNFTDDVAAFCASCNECQMANT